MTHGDFSINQISGKDTTIIWKKGSSSKRNTVGLIISDKFHYKLSR